jgi:RNA polymerase sigma factor (TIGR02999 family)
VLKKSAFPASARRAGPPLTVPAATEYIERMPEVTHILSAIEQGDPSAAEQLLPLVYEELRQLAAVQMAREKPGQTLDATALVHEAYLRLVGDQHFDSRRHFFAAAAEAMRRILLDRARRKKRLKHGGGRRRCELQEDHRIELPPDDHLLALDEALGQLAEAHPELAELVKLRYFAQLTVEQAAELLGLSPRTVKRNWVYASAWLRRAMDREAGAHPDAPSAE